MSGKLGDLEQYLFDQIDRLSPAVIAVALWLAYAAGARA